MAVAMSHGRVPRSNWAPRAALVSERSETLSADSSSFPLPFFGEPLLSCAVQSPFLPVGGGGFDDGDCSGGLAMVTRPSRRRWRRQRSDLLAAASRGRW